MGGEESHRRWLYRRAVQKLKFFGAGELTAFRYPMPEVLKFLVKV
jgi:hypothetical protein